VLLLEQGPLRSWSEDPQASTELTMAQLFANVSVVVSPSDIQNLMSVVAGAENRLLSSRGWHRIAPLALA
jgi:hypothetical protein